MTQADPVMRTGRKFDQVLDGARSVFVAAGFEGASVDDIARAAGVSKATLYSYFPDKRLLFMEVAEAECQRMSERILAQIDDDLPPRAVLTIVAQKLVPFLLSDFALNVFRICVAERDRFPELGQAFYSSGPEMGRRQLAEYISEANGKGELAVDDPLMAAEQFSELCKARLWTRAVLGIQSQFDPDEIAEVVSHAVETFMARYGTNGPTP